MTGFVDTVTGAGARREADAAASRMSATQGRQSEQNDAEAARLRKVEEGQNQNAQRGFGGLLSWISDKNVLKRTLG